MREYSVPFSTREESPFIAGLTVREMLWVGGGFILGLFAALITFVLIGSDQRSMILCLPAVIPCVLLSLYLAKKEIKEDDRRETLDKHFLKLIKYKAKSHIYLNYRKGKAG